MNERLALKKTKNFIFVCLKGPRGSGTGGAGQKYWTHRGQLQHRVLIRGVLIRGGRVEIIRIPSC